LLLDNNLIPYIHHPPHQTVREHAAQSVWAISSVSTHADAGAGSWQQSAQKYLPHAWVSRLVHLELIWCL
jgi:hypothetical protein